MKLEIPPFSRLRARLFAEKVLSANLLASW